MQVRDLLQLMRPHQWYKNLLVFLPLVFVGSLFDVSLVVLSIGGFVSLCLCSSFNYIVNDWVDRSKDRAHPEKKHRPLASGKVTPVAGLAFAFVLLVAGLGLAYYLSFPFFLLAASLIVITFAYSFFLKKIAFADILTVAINFVVRAVAGSVLIQAVISPWLIVCTFFFALFLLAAKRYGDLLLLGDKAVDHKETLQVYTKEVTNALMIMATVLIIMMYTAYAFLSAHQLLAFSLPFALFVIFRYFSLIYVGSPVARHPEKVFHDRAMVVGMILWGIAVFVALYSNF